MNKKSRKPKVLTERDIMKMEIADELGFGDKLRAEGWGALTSKQTGAIGARMGIKHKEQEAKKKQEE